MGSKTAALFSLALFPPIYLFQRVLDADLVVVLSDRRLDDKNHANHCVLRTAAGATRKIEIPVRERCVPIDFAEVPECSTWFPTMLSEVRRSYARLPQASAASALISQSLPPYTSPWLTDYLMHAFVVTLRWLDWHKEIVRGPSEQRRQYVVDSEYLLDLCHQNGCNRLIVGTGPEIRDRQKFRSEGVTLVSQQWKGSPNLPAQDSILDAVARFSPVDILENLRGKS